MTFELVPLAAPRATAAERIRRRYEERAKSGALGVKVNLYRAFEVEALALAMRAPGLEQVRVESVMVGDSYFMTHLGRATTRLATAADREWGLRTLTRLVAEVHGALDALPGAARPLLLGDLPDGATDGGDAVRSAADGMAAAGADVIKVEVDGRAGLDSIEVLAGRGHAVCAHLGYTPQSRSLRRYGDTVEGALGMFATARRARDAGAGMIVLEMVGEPANRALSRFRPNALPVYSIFSGRAAGGGQCLNVWDSVFLPAKPSAAFPPTARFTTDAFERVYRPGLIASHLARLLKLTADGRFPASVPSRLDPFAAEAVAATDPWSPAFTLQAALS